MKSNLLPNKFKRIGLVMFVPFCGICLWTLLSGELEFDYLKCPVISMFGKGVFSDDFQLFTMHVTDPINEIGMLGLMISLCFIALSEERDEDEMTAMIRMKSFVWSFWATAIIFVIGILFLYDFSFLNFAFAAVFLEFVIFIAKFNIEMHKVRRNGK